MNRSPGDGGDPHEFDSIAAACRRDRATRSVKGSATAYPPRHPRRRRPGDQAHDTPHAEGMFPRLGETGHRHHRAPHPLQRHRAGRTGRTDRSSARSWSASRRPRVSYAASCARPGLRQRTSRARSGERSRSGTRGWRPKVRPRSGNGARMRAEPASASPRDTLRTRTTRRTLHA